MPLNLLRFRLDDATAADRTLEAVAQRWPSRVETGNRRETTYFDTFDWRILSWGGFLSSERRARATILNLASGNTSAREQTRIDTPPGFVWQLPTGALRDRLTPIIGIRRILPMVSVSASGTVLNIVDRRDKMIAALRFESAQIRSIFGGEKRAVLSPTLTLLEVRGYPEAYSDVLRFLQDDLGLAVSPEFEVVEAAGALGLNPGAYSKNLNINLTPGLPAAEAMTLIHSRLLRIMQDNEEGLRLNLDTEFLHEFRVAVRRTRSALTQIKGVFPEAITNHFKTEFSWLGQITGPTRDLHVYQLNFPTYRANLPKAIRPDLDPLEVFLDRHSRIGLQDLVALLDSRRYQTLVQDWSAFLDTHVLDDQSPSTASTPIIEVASRRIWRSYRRVIRHGAQIHGDTPAEALHRLRVDCKKLRYLLEFFRSLFPGEEIAELIKELKLLQENLGDFNDFEVQQITLKKYGQTMVAENLARVETLLAMGRLIERLEKAQLREREWFDRRFEKFSRRKCRRSFQRLFKSNGTSSS